MFSREKVHAITPHPAGMNLPVFTDHDLVNDYNNKRRNPVHGSLSQSEAVTIAEIHRKACELFSAEGYRNVGMRKLAASVNLSAGSLYHHIDSKQNVLFELILDYEKGRACALRKTRFHSSASRWFELCWSRVMAFCTANVSAARIARDDFRHLSPDQMAMIETVRTDMRQAFRIAIGRYIPAPTSDTLAFTLWEMLDSSVCLLLDRRSLAATCDRPIQEAALVLLQRDIKAGSGEFV